jgi:hypothetical protein
MKDMGVFGLPIPEPYGFVQVSTPCYALVTEELARGWMSLAGAMGGHTVVAKLILSFGTREQKERYLPRLVAARWRGLPIGRGFPAYCASCFSPRAQPVSPLPLARLSPLLYELPDALVAVDARSLARRPRSSAGKNCSQQASRPCLDPFCRGHGIIGRQPGKDREQRAQTKIIAEELLLDPVEHPLLAGRQFMLA